MSFDPFLHRTSANYSYIPGDFREDIAFYKGKTGDPCEYVPSGYCCPDYYVLKGSRLDYYLWWRAAVEKGVSAETDSGYVWLRCTELINSDDDPIDVLRSLIAIKDTMKTLDYYLLINIRAVIKEYIVVKGLYNEMLPDDIPDGYREEALEFWSCDQSVTWALTRYPIQTPCCGDSWWSNGHYHWSAANVDSEDMLSILMMTLDGIDEYCRSTMGMGFIRALGDEWRTYILDPLKGIMKFESMDCVRLPWIETSRGKFHELIDSILKQATVLLRDDGKKSPVVPKSFPKEYRRIVAAAVDAVTRGDDFDSESFRVGDEGFWEDDDLETPAPEEGGEPYVRDPPLINNLSSHRYCKEDFESHWADSSDVPVPYVPSYQYHPVPDTMTAEQLAFYVYWRTMARRGTFLDTDRGYMWLFSAEVVSHDDDPVAVQALLDQATRVYDNGFSFIDDIGIAACDHALLHNMDSRIIRMDRIELIAFLKISSDPIGIITVSVASHLADWDFINYLGYDHKLVVDALTAAYRAMDSHYRSTLKKRLADFYGKGRMATVSTVLYDELWYVRTFEATHKFRRTASPAIQVIAEGIARIVIRMINKRFGGTIPRASDGFLPENAAIVESAVQKVLDDHDSEFRRRMTLDQASRIVIDKGAIASAADDLAAVTDMMAVDEEGGEGEKPAPEQASVGWGAFFESLDDVEKEYLRRGKPALKGTGRRPAEVEASINGKAMDSVGDAVVENGSLFDEYAEDVMRILED